MKRGKTITELAMEIQRQQESKKDYIVPVSQLSMTDNGNFSFGDNVLPFTHHANGQVASYLDIPRKYYDKVKESDPKLLQSHVNHWLKQKEGDKRLVRTLDGNGRALLSSRYRMLDNMDMMEAVLPTLQHHKVNIMSSEVTDKRLYIKAVFPKLEGEVNKGDVVQSGIVISNSEIGSGSLNIQPLLYRLVCTNGMILPDQQFRKLHIGKNNGRDIDIAALLTDETKELNDQAFWHTVRDVVASSFDKVLFEQNLDVMRRAAGLEIKSNKVEKVVEVTAKKFGFSQGVQDSIFRNLIDPQVHATDLSMWGLANAFTQTANNEEDYEIATALETAGGSIITLNDSDWKKISEVA